MSNNPYAIPESVMWLKDLMPCNPNVHPIGREKGEHYFDLRECKPRTRSGEDFLRRALRDCDDRAYGMGRLQQTHMVDSVKYMMRGFEPHHEIVDNYPEIKEMTDKSKLVESLLDNFYTVGCVFSGNPQLYTYKVPKDWELEEGDYLAVPVTNNRFKIVTVKEVYSKVYNPDEIELKWAIQKVDLTEYVRLTDLDKKVGDTLVELEKRKVKRELAKEFAVGLTKDEVKQLESDLGIKV